MIESLLRPIVRDGYSPMPEFQEQLWLIQEVIQHPYYGYREFIASLDARSPEGRARIRVSDTLRRWRLEYSDRREEWSSELLKARKTLEYCMRFPSPEHYDELVAIETDLEQHSWPLVTYRALLLVIGEAFQGELSPAFRDSWNYWLSNCSEREAKRATFNLLRELRRKPSLPSQEGVSGDLLAEIEDLKAALEQKQRDYEALLQDSELERKELKEQVLEAFYQDLNSREADRILDRVAAAEHLLKRLNSEGFAFPVELDGLKVLPRLLFKFLKKSHVQPIAAVGKRLQLSLTDSFEYDYRGSDFHDDEETKEVEVVAPGWRLHDRMIALPVVREVAHSEEALV